MTRDYMVQYREIKKMVNECNGEYYNLPYYIGSGISRVVFDLGNYIVKYQYSYNNEQLNKQEMTAYRIGVKNGVSDLLAKPIYTSPDYKWMIMEKMQSTVSDALKNSLNDTERKKIIGEYEYVKKKLKLALPKSSDLHRGNVMINKVGEMKAVDYVW